MQRDSTATHTGYLFSNQAAAFPGGTKCLCAACIHNVAYTGNVFTSPIGVASEIPPSRPHSQSRVAAPLTEFRDPTSARQAFTTHLQSTLPHLLLQVSMSSPRSGVGVLCLTHLCIPGPDQEHGKQQLDDSLSDKGRNHSFLKSEF